MDISYKHYMVFPYTMRQLSKRYDNKVLSTYGDQLAFLFQNGYELYGNQSLEQVGEQLALFNYLKTYDDFEDLRNTTIKPLESSAVGYKIVDSVLELIIKGSSWAIKKINDIKTLGEMYSQSMIKYCEMLKYIIDSDDIEISKVVNDIFDNKTLELFDECLDYIDSEVYNILLIKYQKLYFSIIKVHQRIVKKLGNSVSKGEVSRMGNINDELYGSAGGYNPQSDEMVFYKGSALYELKMLNDRKKYTDDSLDKNYELYFLCKECLGNGDNNKLFIDYMKGDKTKISEVRKELANICFNGILVLLCLKHNLSLDADDSLNTKKAEKIMHELKIICDTTGYYFSEVA